MSRGMHSRISETNRVQSYDTRQNRAASRTALSRPAPKVMLDKYALIPISACVFALIVSPLLIYFNIPAVDVHALEARPETRIFWPAMAAISVYLVVQNRSRLTLPPHIICLLAYLAFAGASVTWAFSPERSSVRFAQQVMILTSIVLPAILAGRTVDMMRALFLCFAFSLILNLYFVLQGSSTIVLVGSNLVDIGFQGYFEGKNYLGECGAVAFLLSLHEVFTRGWRRLFGIMVVALAFFLVYLSNSKTALSLALVCPFLAALALIVRKLTGVSVAIILLSIPLCFVLLSSVSNFNFERMSYILYGDSSLTGRTVIWDFADTEIARSPLVGWGYQSFWLVPNSPAFTDAPGWVKGMPNAHNGYIDTKIEMGYTGLAFLLAFLIATIHAAGRVADRDPARARLVLSLVLFIILYNFFESLWMRAFEFLWVVFVIVAAEIGRYWRPFPLGRAVYGSRSQRPASPGPSPCARMPRLHIGLS
jgi:exopolysaccharide production protein ExoQ